MAEINLQEIAKQVSIWKENEERKTKKMVIDEIGKYFFTFSNLFEKEIKQLIRIEVGKQIKQLVEKEVEKQLTNRAIASKGYVKSTIVEMTSEKLISHQKQINKLFAQTTSPPFKYDKHEKFKELNKKIKEEKIIEQFDKLSHKFQEQLKLFKDNLK